MRIVISVFLSTLAGTLCLQAYLAIFAPSSFGRFAQFPVLLMYAALLVIAFHLLIVLPSFRLILQLQQPQPNLRRVLGVGTPLGVDAMAIVIILTGWTGPPLFNRTAYLISGAVAGAIALSVHRIQRNKRPTRNSSIQ